MITKTPPNIYEAPPETANVHSLKGEVHEAEQRHTPPRHAKMVGRVLVGILAGLTMYAPYKYHEQQTPDAKIINIPTMLQTNIITNESMPKLDDHRFEEKAHIERIRWSHLSPHERELNLEIEQITPAVITQWGPQIECEANGIHEINGKYQGALNFMPGSWTQYRGQDFAPQPYLADLKEQLAVARRVQPEPAVKYYGDACRGW